MFIASSGEYAHEKMIYDKTCIWYAPTTYNKNLQEERNTERVSDDVLFKHVCIYYDSCERFPMAGNEGGDTTLFRI